MMVNAGIIINRYAVNNVDVSDERLIEDGFPDEDEMD
jgi:hypothetical protein